MATQQMIDRLRDGKPLENLDRQVIADELKDLLMLKKERGEKIGRLRNRIEAEEARNFQLEDAIKTWCRSCDHLNEACALCPLHDALHPDKPRQASLLAEGAYGANLASEIRGRIDAAIILHGMDDAAVKTVLSGLMNEHFEGVKFDFDAIEENGGEVDNGN